MQHVIKRNQAQHWFGGLMVGNMGCEPDDPGSSPSINQKLLTLPLGKSINTITYF